MCCLNISAKQQHQNRAPLGVIYIPSSFFLLLLVQVFFFLFLKRETSNYSSGDKKNEKSREKPVLNEFVNSGFSGWLASTLYDDVGRFGKNSTFYLTMAIEEVEKYPVSIKVK